MPIDVTLLGIEIEVIPVQFAKAFPPMEVTLLGMSMEVKPVQPEKAFPWISFTSSPRINVLIDVFPENDGVSLQ